MDGIAQGAPSVESEVEVFDAPALDKVTINGVDYPIVDPRASQVTAVINAIGRMFMASRKELKGIKDARDLDYIGAVLATIDEDTLVTLAAASIGSDKKFAADNFSLSWAMPALITMIQKSEVASAVANFITILSPAATTRG